MTRWLSVFAFAVAALGAAPVHADLIDPGEEACGGKEEGDECDLEGGQGSGVCAKQTCSKLDYSEGTPPKSKDYDCLRCQPGEPEPAPDAKAADAKTVDVKAATDESKDKPTGSATPSEASSNAEKKGCSVEASGTSWASLGLGLVLLGFVARRRQR
jgi:MYXO-CTERM domain-containing protein